MKNIKLIEFIDGYRHDELIQVAARRNETPASLRSANPPESRQDLSAYRKLSLGKPYIITESSENIIDGIGGNNGEA